MLGKEKNNTLKIRYFLRNTQNMNYTFHKQRKNDFCMPMSPVIIAEL